MLSTEENLKEKLVKDIYGEEFIIPSVVNSIDENNQLKSYNKLMTVLGKCSGDINHVIQTVKEWHRPVELHLFRSNMDYIQSVPCIIEYVTKLMHSGIVIKSIHCPEKLIQAQKFCVRGVDTPRGTDYISIDVFEELDKDRCDDDERDNVSEVVMSYFDKFYSIKEEFGDYDKDNIVKVIMFAYIAWLCGLNKNNLDRDIGSVMMVDDCYKNNDDIYDFLNNLNKAFEDKMKYNDEIPIVVHVVDDVTTLVNIDYKKIGKVIQSILANFSGVCIAVENVVPRLYDKNHYRVDTEYSPITPVVVVNKLRKYILRGLAERLGTVFDYCHFMMTKFAFKEPFCGFNLDNMGFNNTSAEMSPELCDIFNVYKDTLKVVHLANMKYNGRGVNHGILFDRDNHLDMEKLERFVMAMLDAYGDKEDSKLPLITLEVCEVKYPCSDNKIKTLQALIEVGNLIETQ